MKFRPQWLTYLDAIFILSTFVLFIHFMPESVLSDPAPTGGDTGSHFWPLKLLADYGLAEFRVKMWSPGNLMGEPILVHYFPLPYLVMIFLHLFFPLAAAFKIGTLIPGFFLPFAAYLGFRGLGMAFPAPMLAGAVSLIFNYNESFSQWGGNMASTLAGQFAHQYALVFLLLWIGAIGWELRKNRGFICSSILGALICVSHSYVFLLIPVVGLSFLLFYPEQDFFKRFQHLLFSGLLTLILSSWFLIPMIDNNRWVTPMAIVWGIESLYKTSFPDTFRPLEYLTVFALGILMFAINFRRLIPSFKLSIFAKEMLFWAVPCLANFAFFYIFPKIGLVDVRAVPHIQIFSLLWFSVLFTRALSFFALPIRIAVTVLSCGLAIFWSLKYTKNVPNWIDWNSKGWVARPLYKDLQGLSSDLKSRSIEGQTGFSLPRVAYEHNEASGAAGTVRVFEMLPYFAERSTLESVYLQATITGHMVFYHQALISKTPSCPFRDIPCPRFNLQRAIELAPLLGISDYIFITPELISQANSNPMLRKGGTYGPWTIYSFIEPTKLIEPINAQPILLTNDSWRPDFFKWFVDFKTGSRHLLIDNKKGETAALLSADYSNSKNCRPSLDVTINRMVITTNCIGQPLLLKFAYHPAWKADTGDTLFLVSPGYMAIAPSQRTVLLEFGDRWLWTAANILSLLGLGVVLAFLSYAYKKQSKAKIENK